MCDELNGDNVAVSTFLDILGDHLIVLMTAIQIHLGFAICLVIFLSLSVSFECHDEYEFLKKMWSFAFCGYFK